MARLGHQLIRNIFSSWANYALRIAITFFFIPYITSVLGDARYGVWVIIFQIIGYFSLMDFGLEQALTRFVSKFLGQKDYPSLNRVINTSTLLYLAIGTAVIAGVWLFATFFFQYFKIDDPLMVSEGRRALIVIGCYAGCRFYLLPFGGSLGAFQRWDILNGILMVEELLRFGVMVLLLSQGYGLVPLAITIFSTTLLRNIAGIVWLKRLHPQVKLDLKQAGKPTARMMFDYSWVSFGCMIAWLVIFGTDSILLGLVSSTAAAGVYAPGAQLMLYMRHIVNSVGTPLTPAVSHLEAVGNHEAIREIYLKGVKYIAYLSFFISAGVVFYAQPFVDLWLTAEFAESAKVMVTLAVGLAVFLPQIIGNAVLFGIERHRYLLIVLIFEAALKLILALALIKPYGLIGVALANTIPQVLLYATIYPYFMSRALNTSAVSIVWTVLRTGLLALAITVPTALAMKYLLSPDTWPMFFANLAVVTAAALVVFGFIFKKTDRDQLLGYITQSR